MSSFHPKKVLLYKTEDPQLWKHIQTVPEEITAALFTYITHKIQIAQVW